MTRNLRGAQLLGVKTYSNAFGEIVSETHNGVESTYVPDILGSTVGLIDSGGTLTDRWEYWPYGEVVSRSGSSLTPFTYVGTLGYRQGVLNSLTYVRARHYDPALARWQTVDPLWPGELPYALTECAPVLRADPSGTASRMMPPFCTDRQTKDCVSSCLAKGEILLVCVATPWSYHCICIRISPAGPPGGPPTSDPPRFRYPSCSAPRGPSVSEYCAECAASCGVACDKSGESVIYCAVYCAEMALECVKNQGVWR